MTRSPIHTNDLDFELPKELIATKPAQPRDSSRLLVVQRSNPDRLEHRVFSDLPDLLSPEDLLVFNRSSVVPARLVGENAASGGKFEGLFLNEYLSEHPAETRGREHEPPIWIAMVKAKRAKPGKRYRLIDASESPTQVILELLEKHPEEGPGAWKIKASIENAGASENSEGMSTYKMLDLAGRTPLPPYILSQRLARDEQHTDQTDRQKYQTIYASQDEAGSVAAPTAGLHFTPSILDSLKHRSIHTTQVTLHVGAGTFKPVETDLLSDHPMHSEQCSLADARAYFPSTQTQLRTSGRTFAVGSTSARTLESYAQLYEQLHDQMHSQEHADCPLPDSYSTKIMIAPGYDWRWVDGMITNFHLPRSTLLAMVASLLDIPGQADGLERIQQIYREAIKERYRFFSFGDAMLILP